MFVCCKTDFSYTALFSSSALLFLLSSFLSVLSSLLSSDIASLYRISAACAVFRAYPSRLVLSFQPVLNDPSENNDLRPFLVRSILSAISLTAVWKPSYHLE